jgi:hypothetical protein
MNKMGQTAGIEKSGAESSVISAVLLGETGAEAAEFCAIAAFVNRVPGRRCSESGLGSSASKRVRVLWRQAR